MNMLYTKEDVANLKKRMWIYGVVCIALVAVAVAVGVATCFLVNDAMQNG